MRIDRPGRPAGIQKSSQPSAGKSRGSAGKSGDSVKVSDAASLRERAQVMLGDMSAVNMARIEEIRDALESGSFTSDGRKVAIRIISNALSEHPWS